ncbi:MAG TPA: NFACT RNA binding domain-containing protein, partial [Terriglobia bacterium]|nr:NFACT RNA binding domain-containing protein [Terriglobia bacterium]
LAIETEDIPAETSTSDAQVALRKHLVGGKITALRKSLADRVVFLEIENCRLSDRADQFTLVMELIPNRPRACLLNSDQETLVWLSSGLGTFDTYSPHPAPACRVDSIEEHEFRSLFEKSGGVQGSSPVFGLSAWFAREVFVQSQQNPDNAWQALQGLLRRVATGPYSPRIYHIPQVPAGPVDGPPRESLAKLVIAPFALESLDSAKYEAFPSMNALSLEVFRRSSAARQHVKDLQSSGTKVAAEIKKKERLREKLEAQLKKAEEAQSLKTYANLLYAQHDKLARGSTIRVPNLFDPDLGEVDIPLAPELSIVENANRYHRLYRKAGRSIPQINQRLRTLESEIAALRREQEKLLKASSEKPSAPAGRIGEVRPRGDTSKVEKPTVSGDRSVEFRSGGETLVRRTAKLFRSSEGMQILVGKSSKDNDTLTLKVARSEDFWLHVAGYGGSHVVLRNPEKLPAAPKQSLLEAAQLAAYFSQARNAPKVEVHYTQKKFVSKPKGAKAGLVRLKEYKSISARPQLLKETSSEETSP